MTAGATSWAIGESIWDWYALVRSEPVPSPSVADVAYLFAVPLVVVGIALLSANPGQMATAFRSICDGLIIAGSLLFISWSTVLSVVYHTGGGSTLGADSRRRLSHHRHRAVHRSTLRPLESAPRTSSRARADGTRAARVRGRRQCLHVLLLHEQLREREHLRHRLHRRLSAPVPCHACPPASHEEPEPGQGAVDRADHAPLRAARPRRSRRPS